METNQSGAVNKKVYFSIIVVLLLINTFTVYMYFNEKGTTTNLTSQKLELQYQFRDLSDTLNMRSQEMEQFVGKNAELDKAIAEKQEQLDIQKKKLQSLLSSSTWNQTTL